MDVFLIVALSVILCLLTVVWYYYFNTRSNQVHQPTVLLFIDAPDPDNPAAALALYKYYSKHHMKVPLHIIITGRPVDLRTPLIAVDDSIVRKSWEVYVSEHSQRLLQDSASRINMYLEKCGIDVENNIKIYDGQIAPSAPISDSVHDWDFLFDRKDLITGLDSDKGEILSPSQYTTLVDKYSQLSSSEREKELLKVLRNFKLHSLDSLREIITNRSCHDVHVYIGGPVTALVSLFYGYHQNMLSKVTKFYAMFGALEPGKGTILDNQFNVACDLKSASQLFVEGDGMFSHVEKHLVTTETCKQKPLIVTSCQLKEMGAYPHIVALQELWEYTHKGRPQPLFDVLPIMASFDKSCFSWLRKKAVIIDEKRFFFDDSIGTGTLVVSGDYLSTREQYLEFLSQLWT